MIRRGWGRGAVSGGSWPCGECFSGSLWHDPEGPAGTHPGDSATAPECIEPSGIVGTLNRTGFDGDSGRWGYATSSPSSRAR